MNRTANRTIPRWKYASISNNRAALLPFPPEARGVCACASCVSVCTRVCECVCVLCNNCDVQKQEHVAPDARRTLHSQKRASFLIDRPLSHPPVTTATACPALRCTLQFEVNFFGYLFIQHHVVSTEVLLLYYLCSNLNVPLQFALQPVICRRVEFVTKQSFR